MASATTVQTGVTMDRGNCDHAPKARMPKAPTNPWKAKWFLSRRPVEVATTSPAMPRTGMASM